MTLEEAIANAEAQAIRDEKEAERKRKYGGKFYDDEVKACLICAEQHRQLAEWLKELSERRKQPERKVGEWTEDNACEFCGFKPWYERDIHTLSYCPNCGADMRGERNG